MTAVTYPCPETIPPPGLALCDNWCGGEAALVAAWQALSPGTRLTCVDGRSVMVLTPGRRNRHEGPDFSGAGLFIDGQVQRGAVECHQSPADWFRHGHAGDPRYAGVILHVVRQWSVIAPDLPTVVLPASVPDTVACRLTGPDYQECRAAVVLRLGDRRWQRRVRRCLEWSTDSSTLAANLRVAAFEILGVGGNREAFRRLARLPDDRCGSDPAVVRATLEHLADAAGLTWRRCAVRPAHRPRHRLDLAARLIVFIDVWQASGWAGEPEFAARWQQLVVPGGGPGILTELAGNVFYPALAAVALRRRQTAAAAGWKAHWNRLRLPVVYGRLQRRFGKLWSAARLRSFPFAQGLLELERHYCGSCAACPLEGVRGDS